MSLEALLGPLAGHWQAVLTAAVVAVTLAALLFVQRAPDMVMIGGVVLLLAAGVITPDEALKGMSNEGMVTVAALFIVAAAVERTGALASLVDRTLGRPKSLATAQVRTMIAPGVISAFTNNTPVVALMVPAIRDWAKKNRFSISKVLMPIDRKSTRLNSSHSHC
jgi:Na+/H+ antiporter NhaD/arsenite permease-like protein